jgi:hypothetical protein
MTDPGARPPVRYRRPSIVLPLILIVLGVVFLLNNLGWLSWDIWTTVARLWPLLIIAIGLDLIIGRRSPLGSILSVVLVLAIIGLALSAIFWFGPGRAVISESVFHPLDGAGRAVVEIRFSVGELRVGSSTNPTALVEGSIDVYQGMALRQREYRRSGDEAFFALADHEFPGATPGPRGERRWDLRLTREVPVRLTVEAGIGASNLNLRDVRATDLDVKTGIGKTELTTPSSGVVGATVDGGIGEVVITIPRGMAARTRVSTGIGGVDVFGDYIRDGNVYTSPGFDRAANRIELSVNAGIGKITVRQGS